MTEPVNPTIDDDAAEDPEALDTGDFTDVGDDEQLEADDNPTNDDAGDDLHDVTDGEVIDDPTDDGSAS